jgi:intracellular sulfur oxidation DsrE/DsrF family protein
MNTSLTRGVVILVALLAAVPVLAQRGPGRGFGRGPQGPGHHLDDRFDEDRETFQLLLKNHTKIARNVRQLPNGVQTVTESDDPDVAAMIKEHVTWMQYRVEESIPIRMRDPLFAELFRHTDKIEMVCVETKKGVSVTETSSDPYVARLIQAHAKAVSGFVDHGFVEARKNHPVPEKRNSEVATYANPKIANYGKVVQLRDAAQQPREGSKIVVDVTRGSEVDALNPAIEKVARFVNIYRGAGKTPATVDIAIVLHGDATLAVLSVDAYSKRFGTKDNPNLDCLHELHESGVEIIVCGQSLIGKGAKPDEVVSYADVAVSALTSLVNLQADGYAYVPLGK